MNFSTGTGLWLSAVTFPLVLGQVTILRATYEIMMKARGSWILHLYLASDDLAGAMRVLVIIRCCYSEFCYSGWTELHSVSDLGTKFYLLCLLCCSIRTSM